MSTRPGGLLAWAVLVAAVLQVVAPVVTFVRSGSSPGAGGADLAITPVGWAFAIWGVIYALALAQAVLAVVRRVEVPVRLAVDQLTLYLAGTVWIAASATGSSTGTAAVLVVMATAGVDGVVALSRGAVPVRLHGLTLAGFGLYAGWVSAGVFLNLASAMADLGVAEPDDLGWQAVVLLLAVVALGAVSIASRGNPAYAAAGAWALLGILVTTAGAGDVVLVVLGCVGLVVVAAASVLGCRVRTG